MGCPSDVSEAAHSMYILLGNITAQPGASTDATGKETATG